MNDTLAAPRRLDINTFEMIFVVALITLHDFLLSDSLSLLCSISKRRVSANRFTLPDQDPGIEVAHGLRLISKKNY